MANGPRQPIPAARPGCPNQQLSGRLGPTGSRSARWLTTTQRHDFLPAGSSGSPGSPTAACSGERWPAGSAATEAGRLGHYASSHGRAPERPRAERDRRLLRRRPEPRHDGNEWLGRARAGLVAQFEAHPDVRVDLADGARRVTGRAARARSARASGRGGDRSQEPRRLCSTPFKETAVVILRPTQVMNTKTELLRATNNES